MQKRASNPKIRFDPEVFTTAVTQDLLAYVPHDERPSFEALCQRPLNVADMQSLSGGTFAAVLQYHALFSKNVDADGTSDNDRRQAALRTFLHSEVICTVTNRRLRYLRCHTSRDRYFGLKEAMRNDIRKLLGSVTPRVLHTIFRMSGFGPGSTFHSTDPYHLTLPSKVSDVSLTPDAYPYWSLMIKRTHPNLASAKVRICPGNRIAFVPKDARTFRTIAVEPSGNIFLQKGIDCYLKARLRRWGVTLDDQSPNIQLARDAYHKGFATLDLSAASDTLAIETVLELLPYDWACLLSELRSPSYVSDKKTVTQYEKFSSMGNAFTFPLESLIFSAIVRAILRPGETYRVYGDDIIVPKHSAALVIELLRHFGFKVNPSKTYVFGGFFESCGADFYKGVPVRPTYVRQWPKRESDLILLHNRLCFSKNGFAFLNARAYLYSIAKLRYIGPWPSPARDRRYDRSFTEAFFGPPPKLRMLKSGAPGFLYKKLVATARPYKADYTDFSWYLSSLYGASSLTIVNGRRMTYKRVSTSTPSWGLNRNAFYVQDQC